MDPERWRKVEEIFDRAAGLHGIERSELLDQACGDDSDLRSEVEQMLAADEAETELIDAAVAREAQQLIDPITARGVFGKYEILEKIGEGGFGQVHKGRDPHLRRFVAVKTCTSADSEMRRRFHREAQIAAALQHPNIVTVHDLGFEHGLPYLVQEFLSGEDLQQVIARHDPLDLATRLRYLLQVGQGLAYAHDEGVLHRDVKPSNVRVLDSGQVKILDFGIARLMDETTRITGTGVAVGTVGYLSPEQLQGGAIDQRSDVFSFGVLAYELLSYRRPFQGDTMSQVTYRLISQTPEPLRQLCPEIPAELAELVHRCLRKLPEARPLSLDPVVGGLEDLLQRTTAGVPWKTIELTAKEPLEASGVRNRRFFAAVVAAALLVAVVAWWFVRPAPTESAKGGADRALATGVGEGTAELPFEGAVEDQALEVDDSDTEPSSSGVPSPVIVSDAQDIPNEEFEPPATPPRDGDTEIETAKVSSLPEADATEIEDLAPGRQLEPAVATSAGPTADLPNPRTTDPVELAENAARTALDHGPSAGTPPEADGKDAGTDAEREPNPEESDPRPVASPDREGGPSSAKVGEPDVRQPASAGLLTPGEGVVEPVATRRQRPEYPTRAQRREKEAEVIVAVLVDERGEVARALLKESTLPGFGFEEAALVAARGSTFQPASRDGLPGRMWTEMRFEFRLD